VSTQVRSADSGYVSGIGSFLAIAGGLTLTATTASVLREFRRAEVYDTEVTEGYDIKACSADEETTTEAAVSQ